MKTVIYTLAITACFATFMACGNNNVQESSASDNETSIEEVVFSDECTDIDTTEVVRGGTEGFGRCSESGCYCKAFKGRGQTCQNCGHAYRKHY